MLSFLPLLSLSINLSPVETACVSNDDTVCINMLSFLPLLSLSINLSPVETSCVSNDDTVCINLFNKCPFPVWPGIQGITVPNNGGFKLASMGDIQLSVPSRWSGGKIWARRGCTGTDVNLSCESGSCGNQLQCQGRGGDPPVTVAQFTLNGYDGQDYYSVSLEDGFNLPIIIMPIDGTFTPRINGGPFDCKHAGGCTKDLTQAAECDAPLRKVKNGVIVGCKSACSAFALDAFCCRGNFSSIETCAMNHYAKKFKDACNTAFVFPFDSSSTFTCRGINSASASYTVQFC